jgi:hypothetical protein
MTTRLKAFVVVLDADMREDDAESLRSAIAHMRHVAAVEPLPANPDDFVVRQRVEAEVRERVWAALQPPKR